MKFFQKFKTKGGKVVTLYHKDKKVEKLSEKKAILALSEDFPDLSYEEFIAKQKEMMEDFLRKENALVRGRGRTRGSRKRSARSGRTPAISQSSEESQRQTRSSGIWIEEVTEQPPIPRALISPEH